MALSLIILVNRLRGQPLPAYETQYTNGYAPGGRHRATSAALAAGMAGLVGVVLATAIAVPELIEPVDPPIVGWNVPVVPPPPPQIVPDPAPRVAQPGPSRITTVPPLALTAGPLVNQPPDPQLTIPHPLVPQVPQPEATRPVDHVPVLTSPRRDPRHTGQFQPPYPAARQREEVEGSCRVAVSIATSGRVTAVRRLSCPDDAFFRATERQALNRWRFVPAMRDGEPVMGELEQNVIFRLSE